MIHLADEDLAIVQDIVQRLLPGHKIMAFGSRATGRRLKKFSDLDLAVMTTEQLPWRQHAKVKNAFFDSDISIRVDVLDWAATDESFRRIIEKDLMPLDERRADAPL